MGVCTPHIFPIPFLFIFFCTFSHACKTQLFYFQTLPQLIAKKHGGWGSRERLLGGRNRAGAYRFGFTAERQLEFVGNLRPEFAKHVETRVLKDAKGYPL